MNLIQISCVLPKVKLISLLKNSFKSTTLSKHTFILPESAHNALRLCYAHNLMKMQNRAFSDHIQTPHKSNHHYSLLKEKNSKDITLFINENSNYYKGVIFFGFTQFTLWVYFSYVVASLPDDVITTEEREAAKESLKTDNPRMISFLRGLNLGKYRYLISTLSTLLGFTMLGASFILARRSVKFLILRKGGLDVTFEFFTLLGKNRSKTLPLQNVSARNSRQRTKNYLVLKFRNHIFYYILDLNNGRFPNGEIFDKTVGLQRRFK